MKKSTSLLLLLLMSILIIPIGDALAVTTFTTSFSVSGQTSQPDDIAFNSDGTKMFIIGGSNIYQYTLSTGFDVSTASYSGTSVSVSSQDSNPNGFAFNSDGTKMFIAGATADKIFEYTLNTGFDLSDTVTYSGNSLSLNAGNTVVTGIAFNSDGTKLYTLDGLDLEDAYEYSISTGFDLSSVTAFVAIRTLSNAQSDIIFNDDGSKVYSVRGGGNPVFQRSLSTAYDLSSSTSDGGGLWLSSFDGSFSNLAFNSDGTKFFMLGGSNDKVYEYSVSTAFNLADSIKPTVSSAATSDDTTIILTMSENVFDSSTTAGDFTISGGATSPTVTSISASESEITLNLSATVTGDDTLLVSYTRTSGNIKDLSLNTLNDFSNQSVTNGEAVTPPPPGGGGGCSDCTPPTLGVNKDGIRLVDDGFAYNGDAIDVEYYYTPFDLLTVEIGKENVVGLKIYENQGADSIQHIGLSFGLDKEQIFGEGLAIIEWDKVYGDEPKVTVTDPENILGDVRVVVDPNLVKCTDDSQSEQCMIFRIYHTFREGPDFRIFSTYIWDDERNGWQNYFNHGLNVVGESLNPPDVHTVFDRQGYLYTITISGDREAVDGNGDNWYLADDSFWKKEFFVKKPTPQGTPMAGYDRDHPYFTAYQNGQVILAESTIKAILGVDSIQAILPDYISGADTSDAYSDDSRLDDIMTNKMKLEEIKAFEKMYADYYGQNPYGKKFPFTEPDPISGFGGNIVIQNDSSQELLGVIGLMVGIVALSIGVGFYSMRKK